MQYRPRFFKPEEVVDPETFKAFGDFSFQFFSDDALRMLDGVRDFLGVPCTVNDWHKGGVRKWSGLRTMECKLGAMRSAHRVGEGFDLVPHGMSVAAAWAKIKGAPSDPRLKFLRRVENPAATKTWLHIDTFEHAGTGILVVPFPKKS